MLFKKRLLNFLQKCRKEAERQQNKAEGVVQISFSAGYYQAIKEIITAVQSKGGIK